MQISISNAIGGTAARESFTNNYSIELDGIDAYVDCGTNSSLNFERTDAFSISFWVARAAINAHTLCISKMNPTGNRRGYFININPSNLVTIFLRNNTSNTSQCLIAQSITTIADTNWHHIVFTYDGSSTTGGMKIYIDGTSVTLTTSGTLSGTIVSSATTPFLLGALSTAPSLPADALMDEVAVFGSELSASDVTAIYGTGVPNDITDLSPLSWWRFEEGSGTSASDSGSASNTGTLENSATFSTDVP